MNFSNDTFLSFKFEYYKQLYQNEIDRRRYISSKIPITITVIIAMFSAFVWIILEFFDKYNNLKFNNMTYLYVFGLIIVTGAFLIISFLGLVFSLLNYNEQLNDPIKVNDLISKNELFLSICSKEDIINNLMEDLSKGYINATINNYRQTNKKIHIMNITYIFIAIGVVFLIASFGVIISL